MLNVWLSGNQLTSLIKFVQMSSCKSMINEENKREMGCMDLDYYLSVGVAFNPMWTCFCGLLSTDVRWRNLTLHISYPLRPCVQAMIDFASLNLDNVFSLAVWCVTMNLHFSLFLELTGLLYYTPITVLSILLFIKGFVPLIIIRWQLLYTHLRLCKKRLVVSKWIQSKIAKKAFYFQKPVIYTILINQKLV